MACNCTKNKSAAKQPVKNVVKVPARSVVVKGGNSTRRFIRRASK